MVLGRGKDEWSDTGATFKGFSIMLTLMGLTGLLVTLAAGLLFHWSLGVGTARSKIIKRERRLGVRGSRVLTGLFHRGRQSEVFMNERHDPARSWRTEQARRVSLIILELFREAFFVFQRVWKRASR